MILRHAAEMREQQIPKMRDGTGVVTVRHLLEAEELLGKGRLFAHNVVPPGASIGVHRHTGDAEAYYFLAGRGRYTDNGSAYEVVAGDLTFVSEGDLHGIENTGDAPLEFVALILYADKGGA
ncbi:Cupin 2 conserved barrel domain protein [uncultured Alphaproteobacteria bacterium]|uniref:Cupin 2 conserved barrel domain protein n=1 Tax=uncultured Alphaproteobacteria bacterium TaxID=91750 RepID=A0A212KJP9_9PROT|nr:Cupin 2 conserved barrel domain protein [uncultured Alphaproteobacteria bacterium]